MMQPDRNQQSIQKSINARTDVAHSDDRKSHFDQCAEQRRPYDHQNSGNHHGSDSGYNDRAALAAEEGQPLGK